MLPFNLLEAFRSINFLEVYFTNGLFESNYIIINAGRTAILIAEKSLNRFSQVLRPLGLSEYEVRVFLSLVKNGPANYRNIAKESNVPTGKIYQVLSTLRAKGFVEVIQAKPKIYRAIEPKIALRRRLKQLEEDFFELERKIRDELPTLQLQYSLKHDIIRGVLSEILVGCNSFAKSIRNTLLKTLDEVLVVTPKFDVKPHEEDVFTRLLERGVSIKVLCSGFEEASEDIVSRLRDLGAQIRVEEAVKDKYYVVDDKSVSTFINSSGENICLQIHGTALGRVLKERFEERWEQAREIKR